MSEQQDGQSMGPDGESEGFIDRVKDFFGIRDEQDDSPAAPEQADPEHVVQEQGGAADDPQYDPDELQEALDEAAADGQPNAESGEVDAPIGQEPGRGDADGERRTRHEVTRSAGDRDVPGGSDEAADAETTAEAAADAASDAASDTDAATDSDAETATDTAEERARQEEEFAREHDPEDHDVSAGEEFRQPGDWTADEHGGPQVQDASGELADPDSPKAEQASEQADSTGPEESSIEEVRDGGHGVGSAAPLPDGRQPFGHPVKAWTDTLTFVLPGEEGYDADPHEWFADREAAERAGFRHAHGG